MISLDLALVVTAAFLLGVLAQWLGGRRKD